MLNAILSAEGRLHTPAKIAVTFVTLAVAAVAIAILSKEGYTFFSFQRGAETIRNYSLLGGIFLGGALTGVLFKLGNEKKSGKEIQLTLKGSSPSVSDKEALILKAREIFETHDEMADSVIGALESRLSFIYDLVITAEQLLENSSDLIGPTVRRLKCQMVNYADEICSSWSDLSEKPKDVSAITQWIESKEKKIFGNNISSVESWIQTRQFSSSSKEKSQVS